MVVGARVDIDPVEMAALAEEFETAPAGKAISWAVERFGSRVTVACSFQDCVLVDLAVAAAPDIEVLFLDTGYHFDETLEYVENVRSHYDLNLRIVRPGPEAEAWPCGTERCCELRKVAPLERALEGRDAWITGLKRCDSSTRSDAPVVSLDPARGIVKVNPLATWTDDDVYQYLIDHDLPLHPLVTRGYPSIGCAPTTRPVAPGEDPRSGRWAGSSKTECGLHA